MPKINLTKKQKILIAVAAFAVITAGVSIYFYWPREADVVAKNDDDGNDAADQDKDKTPPADKDKKVEKDKDKDKDPKNPKKNKPKPLPEIDPPQFSVHPADPDVNKQKQWVKPGHWNSATLLLKANHRNYFADLQTSIFGRIDGRSQLLPLENTPFYLSQLQPGILPKGQAKHLEVSFFTPHVEKIREVQVQIRATERGGGEIANIPAETLGLMPAHQYFCVALTKSPSSYRYLNTLPLFQASSGSFGGIRGPYRLTLPKVDRRVPLPTHLLEWSSISQVIWDGINPSDLTMEQQTAMIDWLHFGGNLVISGPDSLAVLEGKNSFLESYLPATVESAQKLSQDDFSQLNKLWSFNQDLAGESVNMQLKVKEPWTGVKLKPRPGGSAVPLTRELLYEKAVGAGRIVVTSFNLREREFAVWRGADNFINSTLFRRPGRSFSGNDGSVAWNDKSGAIDDPRFSTGVRLLSRDASFAVKAPTTPNDLDPRYYRQPNPNNPFDPADDDDGSEFSERSGKSLGEWSDFNPVGKSAAKSLRAAAGIEIPKSSFVLWAVSGYLIILVPVNWLVFKLIGRTEWAWVAAPILAIVGTVAVTKLAHLDIGFTRSEREIAILELHGNYPRGHLTRYSAHYSSLSSNYEFQFDDRGAQALPFATEDSFRLLVGQERSRLDYRRDEDTRLQGFAVSSNSTGLMHTEQVYAVDGGIGLIWEREGQMIQNGAPFDLKDVLIVRRKGGQILTQRLASLPAKSKQRLETLKPEINASERDQKTPLEYPKYMTRDASFADRDAIWSAGYVLSGFSDLIFKDMRDGETLLLGWTPVELAGVTSDPRPSQIRHATLIVAHLDYPGPSTPTHDSNVPAKIENKMKDETGEAIDPEKDPANSPAKSK